MTTPILICDDSSLARKQMARALPAGWDVEVTFAENGREGLEAIRAGKGEIVFLDLNMPEMGGLEVMQAVRFMDLGRHVPVLPVPDKELREGEPLARRTQARSGQPLRSAKIALCLCGVRPG